MAEYIEREALKAVFEEDGHLSAYVEEMIDSIPAADVRPVVVCADCKHNKREVTDLWGNDAIQCITGQTHRHDWFCADGEKKEES